MTLGLKLLTTPLPTKEVTRMALCLPSLPLLSTAGAVSRCRQQ
jgi:hypothetical protein